MLTFCLSDVVSVSEKGRGFQHVLVEFSGAEFRPDLNDPAVPLCPPVQKAGFRDMKKDR